MQRLTIRYLMISTAWIALSLAILKHVQKWLIENGQRMLLVETAGVDDFDYVRRFYANNGFEAEACMRDFYEFGVDKVVFRKSLT